MFYIADRFHLVERIMKKNIIKVLGIYLLLTFLVTVATKEFSIRHSLFLLVDAMLFTGVSNLFYERSGYYKALVYSLVIYCSLFVIRYLTPAMIKVWEVDSYLSFVFALSNLFILLAVIVPAGKMRSIFVLGGVTILSVPIILCWGYYVSEFSWLNTEAVMAVLQTNPEEALSYVKDRTGVLAVGLLLIAGLLVFTWGRLLGRNRLKTISKGIVAGVAISILLNGVLLARTSDNFLVRIYKETKSFQANYDEYAKQCEQRQKRLDTEMVFDSKGEDGVFVLVIGESQNRTRMSAYGYDLETTPWLKSMLSDDNMLLFNNAYSCHVQTAPALTYAMTAKNQYNDVRLEDALSLIEVAKAAGYQTVWLSNQSLFGIYSTPITVIANAADQKIWLNEHRGETQDSDYYDGELINRFDSIKKTDKMLIVVHLMGNHLAYHKRYPVEFDKFSGDGKRSEYDNSVLYNDYVMENIFRRINEWSDFKGMIYFSDHSEAVKYGEAHNPGTFRFDMAYIPLYMYLTPLWQQTNADKMQNLRMARNSIFTNDLIFDTMLGIMGIRGNGLNEVQNDLTSSNYDGDVNRFKTLYGQKMIKDDVKE